MHEAQAHEHNAFLTLTYSDERLPANWGLHYPHVQSFFKRVRKEIGPMRHFTVGEYGPKTLRPHYHVALFGQDFSQDRKHWRTSPHGFPVWKSETLDRLWPHGHHEIGMLGPESAAYVARYCTQKINGPMAVEHYRRTNVRTGEQWQVEPDFAHMSLKPGIGRNYIEKHSGFVKAWNHCILNGKKMPVPSYYDKYIREEDGEAAEHMAFERYIAAQRQKEHRTTERLLVRETVAKAKLKTKARNL